ncbi:MAG: methyltransferase [bacterium]|nr:methyltransferase [bacterium]
MSDFGFDIPSQLRLIRFPGLPAPLRLHTPPSVDVLLDCMDINAPGAEDRIPYWAEIWPSALGLSNWLLTGRMPLRTGSVLEIGAGLGLIGLVTLKLGWDTTITDFDETACRWARRNLVENGFRPTRVHTLDWREPPTARFDTIIAGDILYERVFAESLIDFFAAALRPGGRIIIGEPCRPISDFHLSRFATRFRLRISPWRSPTPDGWRRMRIIELKLRR